jgi:uncharacterized membrane protein YkvA (DUF1232 family)
MDMKGFMESSWVRQARDPQTVARVIEELPQWVQKVQNSELVARALRLWEYLTSGKCSWTEVAMVAGALLYLISPIDAIPDFIPVVGWMDDMAIAGLVLAYLDRKAGASKPHDATA